MLADAGEAAGFLRQAARVGFCAHPVRLQGAITSARINQHTGELVAAREVYSSDQEPGGLLLKPCGNRRASRCPACAEVYRADAYQLVRAGLTGGKGLPTTVAAHPRLFVTFTAPSFGPVHTQRTKNGKRRACRPRHPSKRCPHGRPAGCNRRHPDGETRTTSRPWWCCGSGPTGGPATRPRARPLWPPPSLATPASSAASLGLPALSPERLSLPRAALWTRC